MKFCVQDQNKNLWTPPLQFWGRWWPQSPRILEHSFLDAIQFSISARVILSMRNTNTFSDYESRHKKQVFYGYNWQIKSFIHFHTGQYLKTCSCFCLIQESYYIIRCPFDGESKIDSEVIIEFWVCVLCRYLLHMYVSTLSKAQKYIEVLSF